MVNPENALDPLSPNETLTNLTVGLTGGIASGKSTVSALFALVGVTVIDADLVAREVVEPGAAGLEAVIDHFGDSIVTDAGELDRKALRNIVFSDPSQKSTLDQILHPLIRKTMLQRSIEAPGPYHLIDVPLLAESNWQAQFDRILVVDCATDTQLKRLLDRDGESIEQAKRIIAAQATREQRLAIAHDVIDNNHATEALVPQVYRLHLRYLQLAHSRKNAAVDKDFEA